MNEQIALDEGHGKNDYLDEGQGPGILYNPYHSKMKDMDKMIQVKK